MFFQVFPNGVGIARTRVDSDDFFHNGSPTVAAVVESCEGGGTLRGGVIHNVNEEGPFEAAAGADDGVIGCHSGSV